MSQHLLDQAALRARPPIDAIIVGASAGGVEAMLSLFRHLPPHYRLPIIAALHMQEMRDSLLADLFQHYVAFEVKEAQDKEAIQGSTLYFACPGYHLSIEQSRQFSLSCEPPLHFSRPAIDYLMESAADAYGEHLAGILLTGANEDGAAGLQKIRQAGGLTIVQDPAEAVADTMPLSAIKLDPGHLVLELGKIQQLLIALGEQHVH